MLLKTEIEAIKKLIRKQNCCCENTLIGEGPPGSLPGSPNQFYFDSVGDILYIYDGTGWTTTSSGGGGSGSVNSVNGDSGPNVVLNQDEVLDGPVYKRYSQTEKSKLAGIDAGATANDTDANLLNRANHTGSQAESTITGLVSDLAAKAPLNSPSFTGTPTGITKTHVGLGNVDNTSDANKPISTLQQTALNLKANLASPALTGTPVAPTATLGTNTTQISTTAFVQAAIAALVDSSPGTLDTLNELAAALGDDPNFATTMTNALANKVNISDVLNALNQTVSGKVLDARQGKVLNDLITALSGTVTSHTGNTSNPHSVTKSQIGLGLVPNTDFTTPVAASTSHIANTSNPHSVTKAQVGLGSVDNTADTAKPVSTAQQTALNLKSNIANPTFTGLVTTPLIKITSGSPGAGKVLTSDADGDGSWETPTSGVTDHTLLSNIGTNTHAQIDTHLANTSNPHSVTKSQVGLSNVPNTDFTAAVAANTAKISYTDAAKVAGIAAGATANDTDANLKNRANHTGTQLAATISDIQATITANSAVTANTAKVSNATHTGDVTGSSALTIANAAVTLAKMANMATASLIYRKTAGTGVPEVNTLATLKTDLGLTGTNSGDQTSIAGITGTKAQFDTAVTDGNIMYIGDAPTAHTHTASAITDFSTAVAANSAVAANTAKVSNIAETTTSIGTLINGATDKPTPIDADYVGLMDSAASNILKKLSWANIKATLVTYFDSLYVSLTGAQTIAGVKTFSNSPIVPDPTTAQQISSKKYVDDTAAGYVPTSRALTINGSSVNLSADRNLGYVMSMRDITAIYSQTEVATNLNNFTKTQVLTSSSSNTNNPSAKTFYIWINGTSSTYSSQIAVVGDGTDEMYFRALNAGTWGSWFQVASRAWIATQAYITQSSADTLTNKTLTSPIIQTSPVLAAGTNLKATIPTADTTATGNTTNEFQTSYTTILGDLVYLNTSGQWALVDANVATGYDCLLGIVLQGGITSGNVVNVALPGTFIYMASAFPTFTIGKPIYMSETAGAVTQTQPSTADVAIRVIGYAVHADKMYFMPTGVDFITHS